MNVEVHKPVDDPRVYLAAERTYLAWVRTSLGLMGFGFLVARFGFIIRGLEAGEGEFGRARSPFASLLGCAIVVFGVYVCVVAALRHREYVASLQAGVSNPNLPMQTSLVVATVLASAGLAMALMILTS
ncbi:YidH family protein [Paludisphaera rhizosphaerae]|uniref:YidH family protein n=1 Tax=Paludisphaera rhizosphaerae TaxID=2711216 RepID=UPI0013EB01EC|nr:DUF202 domain-containing protein [Paludisphaera rhizosphaerae]